MKRFIKGVADKKIIIFGTGSAGETITKKLANHVSYYVDNNKAKWNTTFMGGKVLNPQTCKNENKDEVIVIIASSFYEEIADQLQKMGFQEYRHFWNGLELFINVIDQDIEVLINHEMSLIYKKVANLVEHGFVEDANNLLSEYERFVPLDGRIPSLKAYINVPAGKQRHEIRSLLTDAVRKTDYKADIHYNYYLANDLLEKGEYLRALEMFERVLAQIENEALQYELANRINHIESKFEKDIRRQLKERKSAGKEKRAGNYYLHLMIDNVYSQKFIEFINYNFDVNQHVFVIVNPKKQLTYVRENRFDNVIVFSTPEIYREIYAEKLLKLVQDSRKVVIHFLKDHICWFMCRYDLNKEINWNLWGADFYNFIDIKLYDEKTDRFLEDIGYERSDNQNNALKGKVFLRFRKGAIRRVDNLLGFNELEVKLMKSKFMTNARHKKFVYPNVVELKKIIEMKPPYKCEFNFKQEYKHVFMLGNSGDPSNNHLEIIYKLKDLNSREFCVFVPLAYGNQLYVKELLRMGKQILGEQFMPLTKFLDPSKYIHILSQVDVAFMNHNRQQAFGNLVSLLHAGKKVYMKKNLVTYKFFKNHGLEVFDIERMGSIDEIVSLNSSINENSNAAIFREMSEEYIKKIYEGIFC
ncbi:TDP-N-acetylfucosamine:lipid II N-acetylfucosaminyltransferase [Phosphitispora fastidiosa]|uniref:TDP-N-acetylfucosamine:lipid II N-acetylfucosaminyltransferase n=1 Tax=Phosphitispora fastidiosa TaxID=2837202 RepID=UPI001E40E039|nr:TDP-N-acetylfucosamine:lipid II N-acetylfucosaminyltransferase [Phosphitispora fastidiosa]MBU7006398.1 hypothetical protein [Phosphitispora fastidiosa]